MFLNGVMTRSRALAQTAAESSTPAAKRNSFISPPPLTRRTRPPPRSNPEILLIRRSTWNSAEDRTPTHTPHCSAAGWRVPLGRQDHVPQAEHQVVLEARWPIAPPSEEMFEEGEWSVRLEILSHLFRDLITSSRR